MQLEFLKRDFFFCFGQRKNLFLGEKRKVVGFNPLIFLLWNGGILKGVHGVFWLFCGNSGRFFYMDIFPGEQKQC